MSVGTRNRTAAGSDWVQSDAAIDCGGGDCLGGLNVLVAVRMGAVVAHP